LIRFVLDRVGNPSEVAVAHSSGSGILDRQALAIVPPDLTPPFPRPPFPASFGILSSSPSSFAHELCIFPPSNVRRAIWLHRDHHLRHHRAGSLSFLPLGALRQPRAPARSG